MADNNRKAYISYSRRSDYSLIRQLVETAQETTELQSIVVGSDVSPQVTRLTENEPRNIELDEWEVIYDENGLDPFGSIQGFMDELSEGENIIILLSQGYFESPYCMTELLSIYRKRAGNLVPVVVFLEGYSPADVDKEDVLEYWESKTSSGNKKEISAWEKVKISAGKEEEVRRFAASVSEKLPAALAWLLGRYDASKPGWDTLFPVVDGNSGAAAEKVFECLKQTVKMRYPYISTAKKFALAKEAVDKIVTRFAANQHSAASKQLEDLRRRFTQQKPEQYPLSTVLLGFNTAEELMSRLDEICYWLQGIVDHADASDRSMKTLIGSIEDIVGWMLLMAVDDARLHCLVHELNRLDSAAYHEIHNENETTFQLLVSAIFHVAVRYKINADADSNLSLRGDGHIDLLEQGVESRNYTRWLAEEDQWFELKTGMFKQMLGQTRTHSSEASLDSAMGSTLRRTKGFYLVIEKTLFDTQSCHGFLTMLAKQFPDIHQVVKSDNTAESAQAYLKSEVMAGDIDQTVFEIYTLIHKLRQ